MKRRGLFLSSIIAILLLHAGTSPADEPPRVEIVQRHKKWESG